MAQLPIEIVAGLGTGILFIIVFSLFSSNAPMSVPSKPRISQLQVVETVEQDLITKHNLTSATASRDIILYPSNYNFSIRSMEGIPHLHFDVEYPSIAEVKAHPDLLTIPLYYVYPNGTEYFISTILDDPHRGVPKKICEQPSSNCIPYDPAIPIIAGKLVYRLELLRPIAGYYNVDAMDGKILLVQRYA